MYCDNYISDKDLEGKRLKKHSLLETNSVGEKIR